MATAISISKTDAARFSHAAPSSCCHASAGHVTDYMAAGDTKGRMILNSIIFSTLKGAGAFGKFGAVLAWSIPILTTLAMSEIVMGQLIAAVPPTLAIIVALVTLKRGQTTQMANQAIQLANQVDMAKALDGKLDKLMTAEKAASKAEGQQEERTEERDRQGDVGHPTDVIVANPKDNPANVKQQK